MDASREYPALESSRITREVAHLVCVTTRILQHLSVATSVSRGRLKSMARFVRGRLRIMVGYPKGRQTMVRAWFALVWCCGAYQCAISIVVAVVSHVRTHIHTLPFVARHLGPVRLRPHPTACHCIVIYGRVAMSHTPHVWGCSHARCRASCASSARPVAGPLPQPFTVS